MIPGFRYMCALVFILSACSIASLLYSCHCDSSCHDWRRRQQWGDGLSENRTLNLLSFSEAWNHLNFPSGPSRRLLKIAVFVKKWPQGSRAGGLERHAMTLHLELAKRGHEVHIFTTSPTNATSFPKYPYPNLHFHLSRPTAGGYLDQSTVWGQFRAENSSRAGPGRPFDVVHTESVGLMHTRARTLANLAVSWHGIAYETIHSDVIQELLRSPEEPPAHSLTKRTAKVVEEVKFFRSYAHHVATSDHVGDVLKRVYMIPEERVHVILNGVDDGIFRPDSDAGRDFRRNFGVPESKSLVFGIAGRLVKDKGHPLIFEALRQMIGENADFRESVVVLVAGDGPWVNRYRDLGMNSVHQTVPAERRNEMAAKEMWNC